jgi:hypothetical protein
MDHADMGHDHHAPHHPPGGDTQGMGYERRDTNVRAIFLFGVGLVAVIVLSELVLWGAYRALMAHRPPPEQAGKAENITLQMKNLREGQEATLAGYGWVDRKAGVVRVPIERAMDLVAERGVPQGKGPRTAAEINSDRGSPAATAPDEKAKP